MGVAEVRQFLAFTIFGLAAGGIFFVAASGLVLTYATTGVFNFAHGAVGMIAAFVYWQLRVESGLPTLVALVIVVGVLAPLAGLVIERFLIRGLDTAPLATTLVVTVGLLAGLIGVADQVWKSEVRVVPAFFGRESGFDVFGVFVSWQRAITFLVAIGVAIGLRLLLFNTRLGVTMRATVDDRELVSLNGARPAWAGAASWALGAALAALAGILLAPEFARLEVIGLTLLVVDAYAAAVVGRLRSLPLTFLGAMILGLLINYTIGYLPRAFPNNSLPSYLGQLPQAIPAIMLFVVLLLLPQARLRGARHTVATKVKVASFRSSLIGFAVLVTAALLAASLLSDRNIVRIGSGIGLALVVISLVPLTGYAGQVSLGQLAFAGIGAWAMVEFGDTSPWLGIGVGVVGAASLGVVVALPALRLEGLYLALMTLAFALFMEVQVFPLDDFFGAASNVVPRLDIPGLSLESDRTYFVFMAVVYGLVAVAVLAMRRGSFGRRLVAMRDSPAACATLGMSTSRTKLIVFAVSAAIAGLGGAIYWGFRGSASNVEFTMVAGLAILLLAVIGGVSTASGALVGGLFFAVITIIGEEAEALDWLPAIAPAVVGISLARNPDGAVVQVAERVRERLLGRWSPGAEEAADPLEGLDASLPIGVDLTPAQVRALDRELALEEVSVVGP